MNKIKVELVIDVIWAQTEEPIEVEKLIGAAIRMESGDCKDLLVGKIISAEDIGEEEHT